MEQGKLTSTRLSFTPRARSAARLSARELLVALGALTLAACATNTSDDSASAGAGSGAATSSSAGTTSTGASGSGTVGSGGTGAGTGTAGASPTGSAGTSTGSAGAGTGTAGATGSAGSTGGGTCPIIDQADNIADFEGGPTAGAVSNVSTAAGPAGKVDWFIFNDATATGVQTPAKTALMPLTVDMPGDCGSGFAFHSTAMGFTGFGAGFGTDFLPKATGATVSTPFDASAYSGIAFSVKGTAAAPLRVSISDSTTATDNPAHTCVDTTDSTNKMRCGDYFGINETIAPGDWQDFVVSFSNPLFLQRGFGLASTGFDKTKVYTIRMQVKGDFDLWIDNVHFVK